MYKWLPYTDLAVFVYYSPSIGWMMNRGSVSATELFSLTIRASGTSSFTSGSSLALCLTSLLSPLLLSFVPEVISRRLFTVSFLISFIAMEMSKPRSSVCLTSTPISESRPRSPRVESGLTVIGSLTPGKSKNYNINRITIFLLNLCLQFESLQKNYNLQKFKSINQATVW